MPVFLVLILLLLSGRAEAGIYKYIDQSGNIGFSDVPRSGSILYLKDARPARAAKAGYSAPMRTPGPDLERIIRKNARENSLPAGLVKAVIGVESNFNHQAVSSKGAMGLMQLMPQTASLMGVTDIFNPEENIEGGVRYLRLLLNRFNGDLERALAAYNAGPSAVEKYNGMPPYKETKDYVRKVTSIYQGKKPLAASVPMARPVSYKPQRKTVVKKTPVIYKVVLEDGSVLYTNNYPQQP